jgi:hypothetical protein
MQILQEVHSTASWLLHHPFSAEDQAAMSAMRSIVEPNKGKLQGVAARVPASFRLSIRNFRSSVARHWGRALHLALR